MSWQQLTIIEMWFCVLLIICFYNEEKFIAFEQKVVKMFKDIISIARTAKEQKLSVKEFFKICYFCVIMEIEEKYPWCQKAERKLIKDITLNVLCIIIAIGISIFAIQRWG